MPTTQGEPGRAPRAGRLAAAVLASLALATAGALLIAQHLKDKLPLIGADAIWHPNGRPFHPLTETAAFSFSTRYRDRVSVSVVAARTGRIVTVLERQYPVAPYRHTKTFYWDGSGTSGQLAASGSYVVDVHFDRLDRTVQVPQVLFTLARNTR